MTTEEPQPDSVNIFACVKNPDGSFTQTALALDMTLPAKFDALTAVHADLQARFDQMAPLLLDLQTQLANEKHDHDATRVQRDTFKAGFDTQSAAHEDAMKRVVRLRKGLPETEGKIIAPNLAPADGPTPAA